MALGKTLCKQSKMNEARAVYEKGCQATQGENSYIWQVGKCFLQMIFRLLKKTVFGIGFTAVLFMDVWSLPRIS